MREWIILLIVISLITAVSLTIYFVCREKYSESSPKKKYYGVYLFYEPSGIGTRTNKTTGKIETTTAHTDSLYVPLDTLKSEEYQWLEHTNYVNIDAVNFDAFLHPSSKLLDTVKSLKNKDRTIVLMVEPLDELTSGADDASLCRNKYILDNWEYNASKFMTWLTDLRVAGVEGLVFDIEGAITDNKDLVGKIIKFMLALKDKGIQDPNLGIPELKLGLSLNHRMLFPDKDDYFPDWTIFQQTKEKLDILEVWVYESPKDSLDAINGNMARLAKENPNIEVIAAYAGVSQVGILDAWCFSRSLYNKGSSVSEQIGDCCAWMKRFNINCNNSVTPMLAQGSELNKKYYSFPDYVKQYAEAVVDNDLAGIALFGIGSSWADRKALPKDKVCSGLSAPSKCVGFYEWPYKDDPPSMPLV